MADIKEVVGLLEVYIKLEEEIKILTRTKGMSQDILKESKEYRSLLNIGYEIEKQALNGGEIIEFYRDAKNRIDQEYKHRYSIGEEEYKSKINNLENSKNNLRELIRDPINFFNGKIIHEIKKG